MSAVELDRLDCSFPTDARRSTRILMVGGAELNSELDRQAEPRAAGGPNAGLVKPARRDRA